MSIYFNATNQLLTGTAPLTSVPLTIVAWVYKPASDFVYIATVTDTTGNEMWAISSANDLTMRAMSRDAGVFRQASSGSYSLNTWYPVIGRFNTTSFRSIEWNGGNQATESTFSAPSSITEITLGWRNGTGPSALNAYIAEVGVYNSILSESEEQSVWNGNTLDTIATNDLVWYHTFRLGSKINQPAIGSGLTVSGSPTLQLHHPPIKNKSITSMHGLSVTSPVAIKPYILPLPSILRAR